MNSTFGSNQLKLEMLNNLITVLSQCLGQYNEIVQPYMDAKVELEFTPDTPENSDTLRKLNDNVVFFRKRLEDKETIALEEKISNLSEQIKNLEIDIFGKPTDRLSPNFSLHRTILPR